MGNFGRQEKEKLSNTDKLYYSRMMRYTTLVMMDTVDNDFTMWL